MSQLFTNSSEKKSFLFQKILQVVLGFLEIIAIPIFFTFIVVSLNYLNIISLNGILPFLPKSHPAYQPITSQKSTPPLSTIIPTQRIFKIDLSKTQNDVSQYITQTISKNYLPSNADEKTIHTTGSLTTFWSTQDNTHFITEEVYGTGNKTIDRIITLVSADAPPISPIAINTQNADLLTKKYFSLSNNSRWACSKDNNLFICQKFFTTTHGKAGYGIYGTGKDTTALLMSCFIPKESALYKTKIGCFPL